jgi:hypothetical protein
MQATVWFTDHDGVPVTGDVLKEWQGGGNQQRGIAGGDDHGITAMTESCQPRVQPLQRAQLGNLVGGDKDIRWKWRQNLVGTGGNCQRHRSQSAGQQTQHPYQQWFSAKQEAGFIASHALRLAATDNESSPTHLWTPFAGENP